MTKLSTQPYKGTRDFYPDDMRVREYIFNKWRQMMHSYGYESYDAPLLEPLEVYAAKSGQELVNEQTYRFTDRGEREVAIRPEMTPSISRMVAARRQELPLPARLYSIAQFMRYERPQRGREREFWQLNADIFGDDSLMAEIEILTLSSKLLTGFGATPEMFEIRINNRGLVDYIMSEYLKLDEAKAYDMVKLFDRRSKISAEDFVEQAREIVGDNDATDKIVKLLDVKSIDSLPEEVKNTEAYRDSAKLLSILNDMGIGNAVFDASLMRGLDYYTGMVFEVFDLHPENNRALFGGGRYDGLVGLFGAEPISAVGFAPGYSMTELFLQVHDLLPKTFVRTDLYLIILKGHETTGLKVAEGLRGAGISVETDTTNRKIDKCLKAADKKGILHAAVFGENEAASREVTIKTLQDHSSRTVNLDDIESIKDSLSR